MATYVRQSSFSDGDTITAALFNNEFNQLVNAFNVATGHTHDGSTAGDGGPISNLFSNALVFGTNTDNDVVITFNAASNDGVLSWMEDEDYFQFSDDLLIATSEKIQFRDTAIYINSSTDGQLDIVADTEVQIAATTIDMNGNADISGNLGVGGNLTVTGTTTFNGGTITMGDAATDNVVFGADVDSHIIPDDDDTYDLGSSTQEWRNLYIDGTANIDSLVADTADINGGTIDAANITVGSGKTLDVSAGTLTLADNQISGDKVEGGTINATTINTLTYGSITDGTITVTAFVDEDDMSSNSATLIPTQQSVKAYVDAQDTAQDLDLVSDSGTIAIDLDGETLTVTGGEGIDTSASSNTLTITGEDATTSNKGIASFNSDDFNVSSGAVTLATTSTAAELNILDGATVTTAELNLLDGKAFLDEDDMASNSATGIASQQSIKAYVDTTVAATNEVVEDSTPQLGGNLDLNSNNITGTGNINITGSTTVDAGSYTTAITGNSITFNRNGDNNIVADSGSSANLNITVGNRITSSADSYHAFKTGSTPTERVRINSTGIDVTGSVTADGLTVNGNATITGADIDISSLIRHIGDTNTYIGFHGNDLFRVVTNDIERFEVSNNGVIINDTGVDADFRVESNSNAHALFVDAGNNRVSVGASSPAGLFHVYDSSAGEQFISSSNSALRFVSTGGANYIQSGTATSSSSAADLIFTNVGGTGETMRILSGGNITIGTVDSYLYSNASSGGTYIDAGLKFESSNKKLEFWTADAERMSLASDGAATFAGAITANAGVVVDNITIDGNEIDVGSGNFTLDVAGDIYLDADGGDVIYLDNGLQYGFIGNSSSDMVMKSLVQDKDLIFKGNDGGSTITALTLDMSNAGAANFNAGATFGSDIEVTGNATLSSTAPLLYLANTTSGTGKTWRFSSASNGKLFITQEGVIDAVTFDHTSGNATFGNDVIIPTIAYVGTSIVHNGDSNTSIDFGTDTQTFYAGGTRTLDLASGSVVINEGSADIDFRVESDSNTHALFVDAGLNRVGVLTSSPAAPLDIQFGDNSNILRGSYASGEDNFFLELDSKIVTGGVVGYQFHLKNNGTAYNNTLTLDRGNVGVGVESADAKLHVNGNFLAESSTTLNSTLHATGNNTRAIGNYKAHDSSGNDVNMVMGVFGDANRGEISTNTNHTLRLYVNNTPSKYLEIATTGQIFTSHGMVINEDSHDSDFRVESNNNTHMLFVDAGSDTVGIGNNPYTTNADLTLLGDGLAIKNDKAGSNNNWSLIQNTATSGASNIKFTLGTGNIELGHGGEIITNTVAGYHTVFNEGGVDSDFRVESADRSHMFFVDAGNNKAEFSGQVNIFNGANTGNVGGISITPSQTQTTFLNNSPGAYGDYGQTFKTMRATGGSAYIRNFDMTYGGSVFNEDGLDIDFRVESNNNAYGFYLDGGANFISMGNTVKNPATGFGDQHGIGIDLLTGVTQISADGASVFGRTSTGGTGDILEFRDASVAIGRIRTEGTDDITLYSTASNHTGLRLGQTYYIPTNNTGSPSDATVDIGLSSFRYKDLYLSGGAYLGGTGSANKLDDYEEGTWTPQLTDASANECSYTGRTGHYTKIGNLVYVIFAIEISSRTGVGNGLQIRNLPFSVENVSYGGGEPSGGEITYANNLVSTDLGGGIILRANNATNYIEMKYTPGGAQTAIGGDNWNASAIGSNTYLTGYCLYRT